MRASGSCWSNTIRDSASFLRRRFAPARIIEGDAYDLPRTLAALAGQPIAAVVSSLPLLNQPPPRREKLIGDAFALMGPSGVFVQFTYGLLSPIPREFCANRYSAHPLTADPAQSAARAACGPTGLRPCSRGSVR